MGLFFLLCSFAQKKTPTIVVGEKQVAEAQEPWQCDRRPIIAGRY